MPLAATLARRIRSGVRRRVDRLLDRVGLGAPAASAPPAPAPSAPAPAPAPVAPPVAAAAAEPGPAANGADDVAGAPRLTRDEVEALFDDMVRPALQSDGGDITLIDVRDNDVYVRLLGACESCPSAVMTMQMGIERLLQEEFPHFGRLIRVDEPDPGVRPSGSDLGA